MKFGVLLEELDEIIKTRILPDEWQDDFYSASDEEVYGKGMYLMHLHECFRKALDTKDSNCLLQIEKFEVEDTYENKVASVEAWGTSQEPVISAKNYDYKKEEALLRLVESVNSVVLNSKALPRESLSPEWIVDFTKKEYALIRKECEI